MRTFLISLTLTVIGAAVAWWLNQDTYHVKYTLSERIPVDFAGDRDESVQQLEVKNLSTKAIERIQVRLPATVTAHRLIKNSEGDKSETYQDAKGFEVVYSALPPGRAFRLAFKTGGAGVSKEQVEVVHSRGVAEEALGDASIFSSLSTWIFFGLMTFYLTLIGFGLKTNAIDRWLSRAGFDAEKVLRSKRPRYVSDEQWREIREKAAKEFGAKAYYGTPTISDFTTSPAYRFLNSPRPDWLSDEEWAQVCAHMGKALMTWLSAAGYESFLEPERLIGLAGVPRPTFAPVDKWDAVQRTLRRHYVELKLNDYKIDTVTELRKERPQEIDEAAWREYRKKLIGRLIADLEHHDSPLDYLTTNGLEDLPDDSASRLRARAYKLQRANLPTLYELDRAKRFAAEPKPQWMNAEDYERYCALVRTISKAEAEIASCAALQSVLRDVIRGVPISERALEKLEPSTQRVVQDLDRDIGSTKRENAEEKRSLSQGRVEVETLKKVVLRQLEILHGVFRDPASIERIEAYDNPFASGNFTMLREFARGLAAKNRKHTSAPTRQVL